MPGHMAGFARYTGMTKVLCSHCDEPARAFRANRDGTETPYCARHIPNREPRRPAGQFRIFASTPVPTSDADRA